MRSTLVHAPPAPHDTRSAAMPRSMTGKGRHVSYNSDGELCMTVVDPVTRKLLIPTQYIFDTRAQQRGTLPSLCQLFLLGRCRQGQGCYQVHADWEAVQRLRAQVDSLPCCCPGHGDKDHLGIAENVPLRDVLSGNGGHHHGNTHASAAEAAAVAGSTVCARDVVVYVPGCSTYQGSYVPLERVSYTIGLRRLLEEQQVLLAAPTAHVSLLNAETGFPEDKIVADASGATVCRLHAMDRCRYAEECKFLHLCKELTTADPQLTASPATTAGDCGAPECSFDASVTSAGMSGTTAMGASATSMDRRTKGTHSASMTGPRQSVFTSISMQQQQQQQQSNPSMTGVGGNSFAGRPLLVPQREEAGSAAGGAAAVLSQNMQVPFMSKSLPSYHAATNATSTPPASAMRGADPYMAPGLPTAASVGSFNGNGSYSSPPTAMTNTGAAGNGRIRVSLSLPAINSYSNVNGAAGLGTSNSSEKELTPVDETLAAMGSGGGNGVGGAGSLSMSGATRSMPQGYGASSNPTRWHHNPYCSSLSRCEVPSGGSYGGCASMHNSTSGLFTAMTR